MRKQASKWQLSRAKDQLGLASSSPNFPLKFPRVQSSSPLLPFTWPLDVASTTNKTTIAKRKTKWHVLFSMSKRELVPPSIVREIMIITRFTTDLINISLDRLASSHPKRSVHLQLSSTQVVDVVVTTDQPPEDASRIKLQLHFAPLMLRLHHHSSYSYQLNSSRVESRNDEIFSILFSESIIQFVMSEEIQNSKNSLSWIVLFVLNKKTWAPNFENLFFAGTQT